MSLNAIVPASGVTALPASIARYEEPRRDIPLVIFTSIFSSHRVVKQAHAGDTIRSLLQRAEFPPELIDLAHVYVGPDYVPPEMWDRVRLRNNAPGVIIYLVPQKSGGKNPFATVLSIALLFAAPYLGSALAGSLGLLGGAGFGEITFFGISASRILGGFVGLVGTAIINGLAPPPRPRAGGSAINPTLLINGAANQSLQWGQIPVVLGTMRLVPPMGAHPFTETVAGANYVRLVFCLGYGPLEISDLRIGDTPLSQFAGVDVEVRQGFLTDAPLTLYTNQPRENDVSILLTNAVGWQTLTTQPNTDQISIDVTFPRGLGLIQSGGTTGQATVAVSVQYAPTGTSNWSNATGAFTAYGARNVGNLRVPRANGGNAANVSQYYRIYIDQASGALGMVAGPVNSTGGVPDLPIIPSTAIGLARVLRKASDNAVIPAGRITDERDPAVFGVTIQTSTDFLVGTNAANNTVSVAAGGIAGPGFKVTKASLTSFSANILFNVPRGQYDVRLQRTTPDATNPNQIDLVQWTVLRSIINSQPIVKPGMALVAMRIKATNQLNGVVNQFNCLATALIKDWDATLGQWVDQLPTSNPASIYRALLQGPYNAKALADNRIDLAKLQAWHEDCVAAGRTYNSVIDQTISVAAALDEVAAAGRAGRARIDGLWTVVQDKLQTVELGHFTPRNSFGFKATIVFPDLPHAARIQFVNKAIGYLPDERVVYDDGYSADGSVPGTVAATLFESVQLPGVTDPDQAYRDGRYLLAASRLRPQVYQFSADVENIRNTRGDLIRFTHDVCLAGLGFARIKSVTLDGGGNVTGLVVDDQFQMVAGQRYCVRIALSDDSAYVGEIINAPGSVTTVTFVTPFVTNPMPARGNIVMFGNLGSESIPLIIKGIQPQADLTAIITCVDQSPNIYNAELGLPAPFASNVSLPISLQRPPQPVIGIIQTGNEAFIYNPDGTFSATVLIHLIPPQWPDPLLAVALIRRTGDTFYAPATFIASDNQLRILGVEAGNFYDVRIIYENINGMFSAPTDIADLQVDGATSPPADPSNLTCTVNGNVATLSWTISSMFNVDHFTVEHTIATSGQVWGAGVDLIQNFPAPSTSCVVPAMPGSYMVKAVSAGGIECVNAAIVVSPISTVTGFVADRTAQEDPTFAGVKTNVEFDGTGIRLAAVDSIDSWANVDTVANFDVGNSGLQMSGTYYFNNSIVYPAVVTARIISTVDVSGLNLIDNFDTITNVDNVANIDGAAAGSNYSVQPMISVSQDGIVYGAYTNFVTGDFTGKAFKFALAMTSAAFGVTPYVKHLKVQSEQIS